jgi:starch-binding outer membrane protein SusE/F
MKNLFKLLLSFFAATMVFVSCKKDENQILFEGGTDPVLTSSRTGTLPLSFATKDDQLMTLSWTNPDYMFTTGVSSQNVNYLIEIDTTGANFTNPKRQSISISNDLSKSFTVGQFNDFLLNQLQLDSLTTHNIEIRVTSTIGTAVPLYSNVLKFTNVKPYAIPPKVTPPGTPPQYLDGKLFITGSATPASWMAGGDPELASQKFTRVSRTLYVLNSITLTGGNSFLFVPQYGDWSNKYGGINGNNTNNVDGDDFKYNGSDLKAPPVSGNYKIEVDFQRGKYTVTKL